MMNFKKNHPQPPLLLLLVLYLSLRFFLFFFLEPDSESGFAGRVPSGLYKFRASTFMMSCESASSPVSALNPRYATEGILTSVSVKQCSYLSGSASDASWTFSDLSWIYVSLILVGCALFRMLRPCTVVPISKDYS